MIRLRLDLAFVLQQLSLDKVRHGGWMRVFFFEEGITRLFEFLFMP